MDMFLLQTRSVAGKFLTRLFLSISRVVELLDLHAFLSTQTK